MVDGTEESPRLGQVGTGAQRGQADKRKKERAVPEGSCWVGGCQQAAPKPPVGRRYEPLSAHWPGQMNLHWPVT